MASNGEDLEIKIPVGTVVYDDQTGEMLHDFTLADERVLIAQGGRGGHGNAHFASSLLIVLLARRRMAHSAKRKRFGWN